MYHEPELENKVPDEKEIKYRAELARNLILGTWDPSVDWRIRQVWLTQAAAICRELAVEVEGEGDD